MAEIDGFWVFMAAFIAVISFMSIVLGMSTGNMWPMTAMGAVLVSPFVAVTTWERFPFISYAIVGGSAGAVWGVGVGFALRAGPVETRDLRRRIATRKLAPHDFYDLCDRRAFWGKTLAGADRNTLRAAVDENRLQVPTMGVWFEAGLDPAMLACAVRAGLSDVEIVAHADGSAQLDWGLVETMAGLTRPR